MAILEKEVWVSLSSPNIKHFETLGYEIPKYKNKNCLWVVPRGTRILVKAEDLMKSSNVKLTKICDDCGKHVPNQSFNVISKGRKAYDGKDLCQKCSNVIKGMIRKENPPYEKSLRFYAQNNGVEYLLSEFSCKNNQKPENISWGSEKEYIWNCPNPKCKNEYHMRVDFRTRNRSNCPYCQQTGHKRILKGFNDLWTTHPHIAKMLKHEQRGYEITSGSHAKEEFKCEQCYFEKRMFVYNVVKQGFSCPKCSDGVSYPEKFCLELLTQLNIDFEYQKTFEWSKNIPHINPKISGNKIYDFYIPSRNIIIETHGRQHERETGRRGRTLEEENENDELKETLAKQNGIENENYIPLNCSKSEPDHIKNSIRLSHLSTMFHLECIDWLKCHEAACNNLIKTACDLWNNGIKVIEICEVLKLSKSPIRDYLKRGKILGWCDYDPKEELRLNGIDKGKKSARKIVQLSLDGGFIRYWDSMVQIREVLGIAKPNIYRVCRGIQKQTAGFKWMYKEDYEKTILGS